MFDVKLKRGMPIRVLIAMLVLAVFMLLADRSQAAFITQSEVDDWSSSQFCYMQISITNDGWPMPGLTYESVWLYLGLHDLSYDIAALGRGYTAQEIRAAFTAIVLSPPLGEVVNGWSAAERTECGEIVLTHNAVGYDLWTSNVASNEMRLMLSLDKKYFAPSLHWPWITIIIIALCFLTRTITFNLAMQTVINSSFPNRQPYGFC